MSNVPGPTGLSEEEVQAKESAAAGANTTIGKETGPSTPQPTTTEAAREQPDPVTTQAEPSAQVEVKVASSSNSSMTPPSTSVVVKVADPALEELQQEYGNYLRYLVQNPVEGADAIWEAQLAAYIKLANPLASIGSAQLYRVALLGVGALETRRMGVATRISSELDFATSTSAALGQVMLGLAWFVFGFGALVLLLWYSVVFLLWATPPAPSAGPTKEVLSVGLLTPATIEKIWPIVFATVFGCLGSVVSLLLRLPEFEALKGRSRAFLRLTGATLPIIGGIFGAVTAALFVSKIVNLSIVQESAQGNNFNIFLFIVIGFISGFSERFTRNLLSTAETTLSGGRPTESSVRVTVPDQSGQERAPGAEQVARSTAAKPAADPAAKPTVTKPSGDVNIH